jgi:hypothetical protein
MKKAEGLKPRTERPPKKLTVLLPHDLWREASIRALDEDSSLQELLVTALQRLLEEGN